MYKFNAEAQKNRVIKWIQDWFEINGKGCNAVVGISGGKDSTIVAGFLTAALGADRVYGVMLPAGEDPDLPLGEEICDFFGIHKVTVDIKGALDSLKEETKLAFGGSIELSTQSTTNLPPRIRMAATYLVSQSVNGRVANTSNLSEDYVGYCTRYGDGAGDFSPLCRFTVAEVKEMGRLLGIPDKYIDKVPKDGLQPLTDEENLGFTYEVLDRYIRTGEIDDPETKKRIDHLHEINLFKLKYMDCCEFVEL